MAEQISVAWATDLRAADLPTVCIASMYKASRRNKCWSRGCGAAPQPVTEPLMAALSVGGVGTTRGWVLCAKSG
jgi:hypothetical protein